MRFNFILVLILIAPGATAWDQFGGGPDHSVVAPYDKAVNGTLRWKFITGDEVQGSPAVTGNGTVIASSTNGKVFSIARNGIMNWAFDAGSPIWGSPAINEGNVLFLDEEGVLHCLSPAGTELWRYRSREPVYHSSPCVDGSGNIYYGTSGGTLFSVRPDGKIRWFYKMDDFIDSTPAVSSDGTVYVTCGDGSVHAVGQLGRAKWSEPFRASGSISSSPTVADDGSIIFGSEDGYLYSVDADGSLVWKVKVGEVHLSSPAVDGGRYYIGTMEGDLVCVKDRSVEWAFQTGAAIESSPMVREDSSIVFGSTDGQVHCLSQEGVSLWKFRGGGFFGSSSPGFEADGTIVIGCGDGAVYSIGRPYPKAPLFLIATPGDGTIVLNWSMPENETASEFVVYRSISGDPYAEIARTYDGTYLDVDLLNGIVYNYKVSAVNDVGEGPTSNVATEIPQEPLVPLPDGGVDEGLSAVDYILIVILIMAFACIIWMARKWKGAER